MAVMKNQKTGMWEVRTYYKDWTGTRRQKTKRGFAKKSETQEWECAFKLKDEMNINMKFKDFAELYLSDIQPRIKYNSFLTKKHIIETKILPYFGHRKLNEIRPADVIQWQNEIMKLKKDNGEAYSPTYLKTIHNQLSAILNHAVNMYDLKNNVARKAGSMGKEESKEIMFWTQEEYQAFIEQVADKPISYYAFEILYWTGIRETVRVVAAVIRAVNNENKPVIFATQRGYGEFKGGWEFPGGKIESGETPQQALKREIMEELDTEIAVGELIDTIEYDYPNFHLSMDCFWCEVIHGELILKEAEDAKWLTKEHLADVKWLPADVTLIEKIREAMY